MKAISAILGLIALLFIGVACAASAVATSVNGSAQVQVGTGAPQVLRQGDFLDQGATVITGPGSSVVLKFDDGQIAALSGNSRMAITAYQYDPATGNGNIFLSLVSGGMRAITGLIGRRSPNNVAYRAATATIGIRGTDTTILVTPGGDIAVIVDSGAVTFTQDGVTVTVSAGQALLALKGFKAVVDSIANILSKFPPEFAAEVAQFRALGSQIQAAINLIERDNPGLGGTGSVGGAGTPAGGAGGGGNNASQ